MIWIDSSIPRGVATALQQVRDDVRWIGDLYPFDKNKDTVWLADAGNANALVLLRDKKVRSRAGKRRAIIDNRVGCFILTQKQNPTRWQYLRLIASKLDELEDRFEHTPRPFIHTIDSHGAVRVFYPRAS